MPRVPSTILDAIELHGRPLLAEHPVHDVWQVDLPTAARSCTIPALLARVRDRRGRGMPWTVRALFGLRAVVGTVLGLDAPTARRGGAVPANAIEASVPEALRRRSAVAPGTPEGPFVTLFRDDHEAVYAAINATVDARLLVAIAPLPEGARLTWATFVRPVGRITPVYMGLIDPFRRILVYPALERWLVEAWSDATSRR
jgi:hypothetical protein